MRTFLIEHDDGYLELVMSAIHPCDDPPPYELAPAVTGPGPSEEEPIVVIHAAIIVDPEPLFSGPRDQVLEVTDATAEDPRWLRYKGATPQIDGPGA